MSVAMRRTPKGFDQNVKPTQHDVTCADCGSPMELRWTAKYKRWFYGCVRWPHCYCCHGAHPDGRPLGTPGDLETKRARMKAHDAFDSLWADKTSDQARKCARRDAYRWLNEVWPLPVGDDGVHIAAMNIEECELVIQLLEQRRVHREEVKIAAKQRKRERKAAAKETK